MDKNCCQSLDQNFDHYNKFFTQRWDYIFSPNTISLNLHQASFYGTYLLLIIIYYAKQIWFETLVSIYVSCKGITTPSVGRSGKQRVKWQWQVLIVLYLPLPCCLEMGGGVNFGASPYTQCIKSDAPLDARCGYSLNVYYILHKD